MTDREKLIEILRYGMDKYFLLKLEAEIFANLLIANGVTFATDTNDGGKWISVNDRLPNTNDTVLVLHKNRHVRTDAWLKKKWWVADEKNPITHWMPLPEPPKEE